MRRNRISCFIISLLLGIALSSAFSQTTQRSGSTATPARNGEQSASAQRTASPLKPVEAADTLKSRGPLVRGIAVGVNIADPLLRLFGQDYGGYEAMVELNLKNRFFPELSVGMGSAETLADREFTYKTPMALFGRVGVSYNFRYKVDAPNYFVAALRLGMSKYKADITDVDYTDDYWPGIATTSIPTQQFTSVWMELGAGIRVQIVKGLSMGWMVYLKPMLKQGSTEQATPWYTPGYGTSKFGFSYNVYYQLPFGRK